MRSLFFCLLVATFVVSCSVKKVCHGNGVCEVTKNGVTTLEGDADKVAAFQKEKDEAKRLETEELAKIDALPRRGANEPVRVFVLPPTGDMGFEPVLGQYKEMIVNGFKAQAGIEVIEGNPSNGGNGPYNISEEFVKSLYGQGIDADIVVATHIKSKSKMGLIGGKGQGVGVAEVVVSEFNTSFSPIGKFSRFEQNQEGKNVSSFSAAGVSNEGKTGSGTLKFNQNVQSDVDPVKLHTAEVSRKILSDLRPALPSLAALREFRSSSGRGLASEPKRHINIKDLFKKR